MGPGPTRRPAFDLTDLDVWERRVPYEAFARLRHEAPVAWFDEDLPHHRFWSVHRYADIVEISRDTARFSSATGVSFEEPSPEDMEARRTIIDMDPPRHTKLRKVLAPSFTPRAVAVYEHFVRALTNAALDAALPLGEFDFVHHVAKQVPIRVLARIMGLPEEQLTSSSTSATSSSRTPTPSSPTWCGAATIPTLTAGTPSGVPTASSFGTWAVSS